MLIAFIVTREYVRIRRPGLTEQVIHWLDEHIAEPLSLNDAAEAVKCSRSTVSHIVKRQLGMSFKKICILKKIQRFESLIAADPMLTMSRNRFSGRLRRRALFFAALQKSPSCSSFKLCELGKKTDTRLKLPGFFSGKLLHNL
ncbi:MAG: AraC family transcriptional regulator [Treponema sp.]|nr:AraC family transcriptional regulator [Treponema sp.]